MSVEDSVSKLDAIFNPRKVLPSSAPPPGKGTVGTHLRNCFNYSTTGPYPVNPKAKSIIGVPAFPSLSALPESPDLAVLIVPAKVVLQVVDEAIEKGVKGLIIISAGFKETGEEGAKMEQALREKVRAAGVPLIGPNCLGVINCDPVVNMNATFGRKMPANGNLAFLSQSGALCTSVLDYAEEREMGFSKFISFGNKADVGEIELLSYLAKDPATSVIAMYLEDISDGGLFIQTVSKIFWELNKPVLCLKSGRSPEGAKAVSSHTGSLAGSDSVYDALLVQSGVQRVETISELFDYAALYCTQPLPKGNRVGIITNAGGPGIMATDAAIRHGLRLATLTEETRAKLALALPDTASLRNPVDVIGDARADRYEAAVHTVLSDPNVDMGMIILTPQSMTEIPETASIVPAAIKGIDKPVVCSFMGARDVHDGVEILRKNGIPNYSFPEDAIKSLAAAHNLVELHEVPHRQIIEWKDLNVDRAKELIAEALGDKNERYLTQAECRPIFECYKLPLLKSSVVQTADEAALVAEEFACPVVMKVMSADVVHKFDAGGVLLNIQGADKAREGFARIHENVLKAVPGAKIDGILVEEMAKKGVEVILGASRDPRFGPLMMFGLGGTMVEVLKDVSFRLAPMWQISAERMVRMIRSFKVLDGFRGTAPSDIDAIVETLLRLSAMVTKHPEISELDINPLIVHAKGQGCSVADSRIMLRRV